MNRIKGLDKLVESAEYRQALGLPGKVTEDNRQELGSASEVAEDSKQAHSLKSEVTEEYKLLAQGEYNINYVFDHPVTGRRLVLRVNCGSQMHLDDQIEYEYRALKMLEGTGRTPEALYVDGSCRYTDHGILVMEYLPGHPLDYRTELFRAAPVLADIHSAPVPPALIPEEGSERTGSSLICPQDPLRAILEECEQMVAKYMDSELADTSIKLKLRELLDLGWGRLESIGARDDGERLYNTGIASECEGMDKLHSTCRQPEGEAPDFGRKPYRCCINTELNSTNFLINEDGRDYLIDWEKPLYGDPAQDLGHFLAPTTTFWKTDVILTQEETESFVTRYEEAVAGRFDTSGIRERVRDFMTITCLRGITWCAMAWVEYREPGRQITNESTRRKLDQYIAPKFLEYIETILRS